MASDAKLGKSMSKDENELVIAQMVYDGYIHFDFGYTAYATNAYLKATQQASLLLQGALFAAVMVDCHTHVNQTLRERQLC